MGRPVMRIGQRCLRKPHSWDGDDARLTPQASIELALGLIPVCISFHDRGSVVWAEWVCLVEDGAPVTPRRWHRRVMPGGSSRAPSWSSTATPAPRQRVRSVALAVLEGDGAIGRRKLLVRSGQLQGLDAGNPRAVGEEAAESSSPLELCPQLLLLLAEPLVLRALLLYLLLVGLPGTHVEVHVDLPGGLSRWAAREGDALLGGAGSEASRQPQALSARQFLGGTN